MYDDCKIYNRRTQKEKFYFERNNIRIYLILSWIFMSSDFDKHAPIRA